MHAQLQANATRLEDITQDILTAEERLSARTRQHQVISDGVIAAQKAIWLLKGGHLLFDRTQRRLVYADDDPFLTQTQFEKNTDILKRAEPILTPIAGMLHRANTALLHSVRNEHIVHAQRLADIQERMGIAPDADLNEVIADLKHENDLKPEW